MLITFVETCVFTKSVKIICTTKTKIYNSPKGNDILHLLYLVLFGFLILSNKTNFVNRARKSI